MKNEEREQFKKEFAERLIRFSVSILHFSDQLRKNPTLWPGADQLVRSSTSVGANVHEAKGAASKKDFINYFHIALKSAKETTYWLVVVSKYDSELEKETAKLINGIDEIARILNSSLLTMKDKK